MVARTTTIKLAEAEAEAADFLDFILADLQPNCSGRGVACSAGRQANDFRLCHVYFQPKFTTVLTLQIDEVVRQQTNIVRDI